MRYKEVISALIAAVIGSIVGEGVNVMLKGDFIFSFGAGFVGASLGFFGYYVFSGKVGPPFEGGKWR